jgi:2-polyprenyl-3-methyl-5-hydroxy-6-metoxy-1,4-benzoquinol methylase
MGFFDRYPRFYRTSITGTAPNRLNVRYETLIRNNLNAIRGQTILDLGSHDGRWSFAAIRSGAKRVVGIEGRHDLVAKAVGSMEFYGVSRERYSFIAGDVLHVTPHMEPGSFDTIFCFGILYHTSHQMQMINAIARLQPKVLLIDSRVALSEWAIIAL